MLFQQQLLMEIHSKSFSLRISSSHQLHRLQGITLYFPPSTLQLVFLFKSLSSSSNHLSRRSLFTSSCRPMHVNQLIFCFLCHATTLPVLSGCCGGWQGVLKLALYLSTVNAGVSWEGFFEIWPQKFTPKLGLRARGMQTLHWRTVNESQET